MSCHDRERSLAAYIGTCPVNDKAHDWRYASDAPGWKLGDDCARCERCQLKGIKPVSKEQA